MSGLRILAWDSDTVLEIRNKVSKVISNILF